MTAITVVFCGVLGLLIGSFLNVVIWRVPRSESIVRPPSHCPNCETPTPAEPGAQLVYCIHCDALIEIDNNFF